MAMTAFLRCNRKILSSPFQCILSLRESSLLHSRPAKEKVETEEKQLMKIEKFF